MRASGCVHIVIRFGPAAHRGLKVDDCPQEAVIKSCEHLSAESGHGELSDSFGCGFLKVISHWDLKKVASFLVAAVPAEPPAMSLVHYTHICQCSYLLCFNIYDAPGDCAGASREHRSKITGIGAS